MFLSSKNMSTLMSPKIRCRQRFYIRLKSVVTWYDVCMFHPKWIVFCTLYNYLIKKITKKLANHQATRVGTHLIEKNCHPGSPPRGHLPKVLQEVWTSHLKVKVQGTRLKPMHRASNWMDICVFRFYLIRFCFSFHLVVNSVDFRGHLAIVKHFFF